MDDEVERYLRSGEANPLSEAWPGGVRERASMVLRDALVREVGRLAGERRSRPLAEVCVRGRVEPMVRGLFPRKERGVVLGVVEQSVVFVTSESVEGLLRGQTWLSSAWTLANLYLASVGAELLGPEARRVLGFSEGTRCYVSWRYFEEEDPFADFVVHEVAHIFHNCKRNTVGLPSTRRREWLLEIDFSKRETFAYACEAYSRMVRARPLERRRLADAFAERASFADERVSGEEVGDLVREAAAARNGWKVILRRCARRPRRGTGGR